MNCFRCWRKTEMQLQSLHVCYWAISGLHAAGTPARSRSAARVIRRPAIFRNATVLQKFSDMSDDLSAL
jgi:hypothetical protein